MLLICEFTWKQIYGKIRNNVINALPYFILHDVVFANLCNRQKLSILYNDLFRNSCNKKKTLVLMIKSLFFFVYKGTHSSWIALYIIFNVQWSNLR